MTVEYIESYTFYHNFTLPLVMKFSEKLQVIFNSGDPVVRKWFLVRNNYLPFMLCFGYVFTALTGPYLMRNRKPFNLRKIMVAFNFSVVIVYITALLFAFYNIPKVPWEMFCKGGVLVEGELPYLLISTAWGIYLLKYIEFLDTLFFILRKKENHVSLLHVLHHFLVPLIGWIGFRTEKSAIQTVPGMINAIVHVIMYTYYGMAAMGPEMRKYLWWKKHLTQLQIVQFIIIILFITVIAPVSGCTMVNLTYGMGFTLAPLFLYLFYEYYKATFKVEEKKLH